MAIDVSSALGLGRDATALTFWQISLRGILVFGVALVAVRCGARRFLSNKTAFDAVLGFILASMLARAVNGTAAFFPTLGGAFVLVMLHRALADCSHRSHRFGNLVKGAGATSSTIFLRGNVDRVSDVALGVYERNGQISVVRRYS